MSKPTLQVIDLPVEMVDTWRAALEADEDDRVGKTQSLMRQVEARTSAEDVANALLWATYDEAKAGAAGAQAVVAQLIAYGGANPLDYLIEKTTVPFELWAPTIAALRRREESHQPMRLHEGGNVAHYLCSVHRLGPLRMLMRMSHIFPPAWTNAQRDDGCTPLMVIWDTLINNDLTPDDACWETSAMLLDLGCDPLASDKQGKNMLDRLQLVWNRDKKCHV